MFVRLFVKKVWLWSFLVTIPISVISNQWLFTTSKTYFDFMVRYDIAPATTSLTGIARSELAYILRDLKLQFIPDHEKLMQEQSSTFDTIDLMIPAPGISQLNSLLPHSGFEYVEASLLNQGSLRKVKVRYRGDYNYHWMFQKKSFRVKTKKARLFNGVRKFNLIANKFGSQLGNYPGYLLARYMGNITPQSKMVNLRINGRNAGTHTFVEQVSESTLRRLGHMPGDIFIGELSAKDRFVGDKADLFIQGGKWEKAAVNNHFEESANLSIQTLTTLISAAESEANEVKLRRLIDIEEWGRFLAFETIAQTEHYDEVHNWRLFYDPWKTRFIPIVWDPVAWAWSASAPTKPDILRSRIQRRLLRNAPILAARSRYIVDFYQSGRSEQVISELEETVVELDKANRLDPKLRPQGSKAVLAQMLAYKDNNIIRSVRNVGQIYDVANCEQSYTHLSPTSIRVQITGRCAVDDITLLVLSETGTAQESVELEVSYVRDGEKVKHAVLGTMLEGSSAINLGLTLMAEHRYVHEKQEIELLPATYDIAVIGAPTVQVVSASATIHGKSADFEEVDSIGISQVSMFGIIDTSYSSTVLVWSGEKIIEGTVRINQPLVIEPGTTVRLAEQASLLVRGKVTAKGLPDLPIRFLPTVDSEGPWGTVAILTEKANGSEFIGTEFVGGSGLKSDLYEYTAMFSVHEAKGVKIDQSTFRDNSLVDDMVHFVYADVQINNSRFIRSHLDSIDADISTISVKNSFFSHSGNDALDLMTTDATVTNTRIVNSIDKAISIGEASNLQLRDSEIFQNEIGVQAKDSSTVKISNVSFIDNQVAIDAYKKNWRYGDGGHVEVQSSLLKGNKVDVKKDKKSSVKMLDPSIPQAFTGKKVNTSR